MKVAPGAASDETVRAITAQFAEGERFPPAPGAEETPGRYGCGGGFRRQSLSAF